jgi:hypothetical protein
MIRCHVQFCDLCTDKPDLRQDYSSTWCSFLWDLVILYNFLGGDSYVSGYFIIRVLHDVILEMACTIILPSNHKCIPYTLPVMAATIAQCTVLFKHHHQHIYLPIQFWLQYWQRGKPFTMFFSLSIWLSASAWYTGVCQLLCCACQKEVLSKCSTNALWVTVLATWHCLARMLDISTLKFHMNKIVLPPQTTWQMVNRRESNSVLKNSDSGILYVLMFGFQALSRNAVNRT